MLSANSLGISAISPVINFCLKSLNLRHLLLARIKLRRSISWINHCRDCIASSISLMTWPPIRLGKSLYKENSTCLGSINKNCKSNGVAFNANEVMIAFKQTLLPLPVCPAINKCGVSAISIFIGFPRVSIPSVAGRILFDVSE